MTEYELEIVQRAFDKSMTIGAPGISQTVRRAVIITATTRIRHQLNLPAPPLSTPVVVENVTRKD